MNRFERARRKNGTLHAFLTGFAHELLEVAEVAELRLPWLLGTMAIELTGGSLFLIVLSLLFVDVSVMMLGFQVNDRACRDACRAAAQQSSSSQAIAAAKAKEAK